MYRCVGDIQHTKQGSQNIQYKGILLTEYLDKEAWERDIFLGTKKRKGRKKSYYQILHLLERVPNYRRNIIRDLRQTGRTKKGSLKRVH